MLPERFFSHYFPCFACIALALHSTFDVSWRSMLIPQMRTSSGSRVPSSRDFASRTCSLQGSSTRQEDIILNGDRCARHSRCPRKRPQTFRYQLKHSFAFWAEVASLRSLSPHLGAPIAGCAMGRHAGASLRLSFTWT